MKRLLFFLLALSFLLPSCGSQKETKSAGEIAKAVEENAALFQECYQILADMKKERIYVAMEEKEDENGNKIENSLRLVSYEKETDDRAEMENEILEKVLVDFDLTLLFFQTASDGRTCLIFSYSKEAESDRVQNGFYFSPDSLPCAFWGRRGNLVRSADRYLQMNQKGDAVYYTTKIWENFYYFEKYGNLLA